MRFRAFITLLLLINISSAASSGDLEDKAKADGVQASTEAEILISEVRRLASQKEYDKAIQVCNQALDASKKRNGIDHIEVIVWFINLAELNRLKNNYVESEQYQLRALAGMKRLAGETNPVISEILHQLVIIFREQGKFSDAELAAQESLRISIINYGDKDPRVAVCINDLACILGEQGKLDVAGKMHLAALAIREESFGRMHPQVAQSLINLGIVMKQLGQLDAAERAYRRALKIMEASLGPDHQDIASALENLSKVAPYTGLNSEAEVCLRRAIAINEKIFGGSSTEVALSFIGLAEFYGKSGRYSLSESLLRKSLEILKKNLPEENIWCIAVTMQLGDLLAVEAKYNEAEEMLGKAYGLTTKVYGARHYRVGNCLVAQAALLCEQGRYTDSIETFNDGLLMIEAGLGKAHPSISSALNNRAVTCLRLKKFIESEQLCRKSIELIKINRNSSDHPDLIEVLNNLAVARIEQGDRKEGFELLDQSHFIANKSFGENSIIGISSQVNYALLIMQFGKVARANEIFVNAEVIAQKTFGTIHPTIAYCQLFRGDACVLLNENQDAEKLYRQSLEIFEKACGNNHPDVALVLSRLVSFLKANSRAAEAAPLEERAIQIRNIPN